MRRRPTPQPDAWTALVLSTMSTEEIRAEVDNIANTPDQRAQLAAELERRSRTKTSDARRRYEIEAYKLRGRECWRIIDTFNGGKVVAKGFEFDALAIGRRDELNALNGGRS